MTAAFLLGAVLMLGSIVALRVAYGRSWVGLPYGMFVIMAVVYHLATEVLIRLTDTGRFSTDRPPLHWVDRGVGIASMSVAVTTAGYLIGNRRRRGPVAVDREDLLRGLDLRVLLLLLVPMVIATVSGQGYINGAGLNGGGLSVRGLTIQIFVPVVILTSLAILARHRSWLIPVILGQSLLLGLAGQRLEVGIAGVMVLAMAPRMGPRPSLAKVLVSASILVVVMAAITGVRASVGRDVFYGDSGVSARAAALAEGLGGGLDDPAVVNKTGSVIGDAALRLNSNSWTGNVAWALAKGGHPTGAGPAIGAFTTFIPSALYRAKLTTAVADRNPEDAAIVHLAVPAVDYLPGHVTLLYGALPLGALLVFMALFGIGLGAVEGRVCSSRSVLGVLGYVVLGSAALFFERGVSEYANALRTVLILGPVLLLTRWLNGRRARQKESGPAQEHLPSADATAGG